MFFESFRYMKGNSRSTPTLYYIHKEGDDFVTSKMPCETFSTARNIMR